MHTTLPRRFYADPDFYRAELERFYLNRWICAGRAGRDRPVGATCERRRQLAVSLVLPFIITVTYSGAEAPAPQGARRENTGSI